MLEDYFGWISSFHNAESILASKYYYQDVIDYNIELESESDCD